MGSWLAVLYVGFVSILAGSVLVLAGVPEPLAFATGIGAAIAFPWLLEGVRRRAGSAT